ncbi:MAG: pyridoxamine 5'-phosphate oxidase family protein [Eubacteriales bacterium]|nr:pyridoxamine 5'-phosphate oxidase family protein [Eubacteriales bacterium]
MNKDNRTTAEKINDWLNECVEQSETFFLTTVDNNKPKSRPISFHMLKDGINYFGVGEMKEVYRQMQENSYVEITGLMGKGTQFIRYYGKAVFAEGSALAKEALEQPGYPVMKKIYAEGTGNVFGVFHLEEAVCERRAMMSVIETLHV